MNPASALTTPRKWICPISRHFFPVEQPEPPLCCTTGLKKGSRFPFIAHFFFSSAFGALGASMALIAGDCFSAPTFVVAVAVAFVVAGAATLAPGFEVTLATSTLGAVGVGIAATFGAL